MKVLLTGFMWWLMQPEASSSGAADVAAGPASPGGPAGCAAAGPNMLLLIMMFGIMYFMLLRPQQKRQREVDDMLKALKKGDKVRTTGGIRGEILELTEAEVTLLIADKTKINILRANVGAKIPKPAPESKGKD